MMSNWLLRSLWGFLNWFVSCFLMGLPWVCRYLAALISQSFLDIGSVSRILDSIINLCLQLCRVIEQEDGAPNLTELEHITEVWHVPLYIVFSNFKKDARMVIGNEPECAWEHVQMVNGLNLPTEQVHSWPTYSEKTSTIWRCLQFLSMIDTENCRVVVVGATVFFIIFPSAKCLFIIYVFCNAKRIFSHHHLGVNGNTDNFYFIQEFNRKSNSLYTILRSSKLAGSQRAPFLRQFLLRLNYNSFFEVRSFH